VNPCLTAGTAGGNDKLRDDLWRKGREPEACLRRKALSPDFSYASLKLTKLYKLTKNKLTKNPDLGARLWGGNMQNILRRGRLRPPRGIWSLSREVHSRKWRSTVALQALDQLTAGVIIAEGHAEVVEMNRAAEAIVQLEDGLLIRNDRLCARRAFETAKVTKLIAGATVESRSAAAAGHMLIGRYDGLPAYVLSVAPLHTGLAVGERQFAMVVVVDPALHSPSEKDLAEFFGLSPAEARLAAALLSGETVSQIAANTGVRITTLRTQLGSILRKVGAARQSDLIRILSGTGIGSVSFSAAWFDIAEVVAQLPLSLAAI